MPVHAETIELYRAVNEALANNQNTDWTTMEPLEGEFVAAPSFRTVVAPLEVFQGKNPHLLFFGIDGENSPVFLNTNDSTIGSILITADAQGGKSHLLKVIATAAGYMHPEGSYYTSVLTNEADKWVAVMQDAPNVRADKPDSKYATEVLDYLVNQCHKKRQDIVEVLLIDNLAEMIKQNDAETLNQLRFILLRGPAHNIWPIVTVNSSDISEVSKWLDLFKTRIFGRIEKQDVVAKLTTPAVVNAMKEKKLKTEDIIPAVEYLMPQGETAFGFWIPSLIDETVTASKSAPATSE